jgi:hypothetical protein
LLSTLHRRWEFMNGDGNRVAKFLPRFDGPYVGIFASLRIK